MSMRHSITAAVVTAVPFAIATAVPASAETSNAIVSVLPGVRA